MKKKLLSVILAGIMTATLFTACGGKTEETKAPAADTKEETAAPAAEPEAAAEDAAAKDAAAKDTTAEDGAKEDAADGMVSDEDFATLQDNYNLVVECYNQVAELYSSDEIAANADIEEAMTLAADIIEEMGEITQDTLTEEDAQLLNEAMEDILNGFADLVDGMEAADSTEDGVVSDETFAALQENYAALTEAYNAVAELYNDDSIEANADVENALNQAYDIIEKMGTIEQTSITEADAEALNDAMVVILEVLDAAIDAM